MTGKQSGGRRRARSGDEAHLPSRNLTASAAHLRESVNAVIPAEADIESVGYFTPSWHRKGVPNEREKRIRVVRDDFQGELIARVTANTRYGLPITADLVYYRAFQWLLWDKIDATGKIPEWMTFSTRSILKRAGRERGRERGVLSAWRHRLHGTLIIYEGDMEVLDQLGMKPDASRTIFSETYGWEDPDRPDIDGMPEGAHMVHLPEWYRRNLESRPRPLDIEADLELRSPIALALSAMLDPMFFAASHRAKGRYAITVRKRYDEVCKDFLLTEHHYTSYVQQQFRSACQELKEVGKIVDWGIEPAKGGGFLLYWTIGPRILEAWRVWKNVRLPGGHTAPARPQLTLHRADETAAARNGQAVLLVRMFHDKCRGIKNVRPTSKEIEQALDLIGSHDFNTAAQIVEHVVASMKETRFDARFFGAVVSGSYVADAVRAIERRERQATEREEAQRRRIAEQAASQTAAEKNRLRAERREALIRRAKRNLSVARIKELRAEAEASEHVRDKPAGARRIAIQYKIDELIWDRHVSVEDRVNLESDL